MRFVARDLNCARIAPRDAGLGPRGRGDPSMLAIVLICADTLLGLEFVRPWRVAPTFSWINKIP